MLKTGEILFDEFRIDGLIENDKNGSTYRAFDLRQRRKVSITTLNINKFRQDIDAARALQDQLQREINLSARLVSPHLLHVYRSILSAEDLYIFTEYIPGFCLADQMNAAHASGKQPSAQEVRQIGIQIASGLKDLHNHGILHLNLTPSNTFITVKGELKISGLGNALTPKSRYEGIMNNSFQDFPPESLDYQPPERKNRVTTYPRPNMDIYAAGCVLFELVTGRKYSQMTSGTHTASLRADVPHCLDDLIAQTVSDDPAERPWDGFELLERLQKASSSPTGNHSNQVEWMVGEAGALAEANAWDEVEGILTALNALGNGGKSAARQFRIKFNIPFEQEYAPEDRSSSAGENGAGQKDISGIESQVKPDTVMDEVVIKRRPRMAFLGFGVIMLCFFSAAFLFLINQGFNYFLVSTAFASLEEVEIEEIPQIENTEPVLEFIVEENPVTEFIIGRGSDSIWLDPALASDQESIRVSALCLEGLYTQQPGDTEPQPALATGCTADETGTEWTCSLRGNVQFHDGTPFNADAVIFNFERWRSSDHPQNTPESSFDAYQDSWGGFDESSQILNESKIDDLTVKFTLKKPKANFLDLLALEAFSISSPSALESFKGGYGGSEAGCVGTGPFMFSEWQADEQITLNANQTYWYGPPQIDQIVWKVIPDPNDLFQALLEGSIHAALETNPEILSAAEVHPDFLVILANYPPPVIVSYTALGAITRIKGFDVYSETELME